VAVLPLLLVLPDVQPVQQQIVALANKFFLAFKLSINNKPMIHYNNL